MFLPANLGRTLSVDSRLTSLLVVVVVPRRLVLYNEGSSICWLHSNDEVSESIQTMNIWIENLYQCRVPKKTYLCLGSPALFFYSFHRLSSSSFIRQEYSVNICFYFTSSCNIIANSFYLHRKYIRLTNSIIFYVIFALIIFSIWIANCLGRPQNTSMGLSFILGRDRYFSNGPDQPSYHI